jgi:hypothetical protein
LYELESFAQLGIAPVNPAVQDNGSVLLPKSEENLLFADESFR